jgi:hypothetical protein
MVQMGPGVVKITLHKYDQSKKALYLVFKVGSRNEFCATINEET